MVAWAENAMVEARVASVGGAVGEQIELLAGHLSSLALFAAFEWFLEYCFEFLTNFVIWIILMLALRSVFVDYIAYSLNSLHFQLLFDVLRSVGE